MARKNTNEGAGAESAPLNYFEANPEYPHDSVHVCSREGSMDVYFATDHKGTNAMHNFLNSPQGDGYASTTIKK